MTETISEVESNDRGGHRRVTLFHGQSPCEPMSSKRPQQVTAGHSRVTLREEVGLLIPSHSRGRDTAFVARCALRARPELAGREAKLMSLSTMSPAQAVSDLPDRTSQRTLMSGHLPKSGPLATILWIVALTASAISLGCDGEHSDGSVPAYDEPGGAAGESPFQVIASDTGFVASSSIPSGMRHILFENRGTEIHEAMFVKLPEGMDGAGYVAAVRAGDLFPKGALDYSGPGLTSPGETTELWFKLDPGRYILICFNSGHARSTAVHPFIVQPNVVNDPPPKEDVVVRLVDYHFELFGELKSGLRVLRIETKGPSMHEADLFRLDEGRTVDDLKRWRKQGSGPAPARALGGALDSHDITRVMWVRRAFSPGPYALHCEMPMNASAAGGPTDNTHADLGMSRVVTIPE